MYADGTYYASAREFDGDVSVAVTIENDTIVAIEASTTESVPGYFEKARGPVISNILGSQSTGADGVSGATYSSNALIAAVADALQQARNQRSLREKRLFPAGRAALFCSSGIRGT